VFAHGSGSGRSSPRNRAVADALNIRGITTLLFDLLTRNEEADRANVFDIALLADRLVDALRWLDGQPKIAGLSLASRRSTNAARNGSGVVSFAGSDLTQINANRLSL
jgi:hypothetical protein